MAKIRIIPLEEQKLIVNVIEDINADHYKSQASIKSIMDKFGLTYQEYRVCANLAMPSIRATNNACVFERRCIKQKSIIENLKKKHERSEGKK